MREFHCRYCGRVLCEGDFQGKVVVHCKRCKSRNIVQSIAGSYVVTVSLDRRAERRQDNLPLPTRVVLD